MKLIREEADENDILIRETLDESAGKKTFMIEGIFMQSNVKNRNGRIYPKAVMENALKAYNENYVSKGRAVGEMNHPDGPGINLDRVSHLITELKMVGDNVMGKAKLTDTPKGNLARGLMESGVQLGVSSRGLGSIKESGGASVVQSDFRIITGADLVADPSAPDAWVNGIMEGVEWVWDNGELVERHLEETRKKIDKKQINEEVAFKEFKALLSKLTQV